FSRQHFALVQGDPAWRAVFLSALVGARAGFDADGLADRVDAWAAQIGAAAEADAMKPFDADAHHDAVAALRGFLAPRAAALDGWLACAAAAEGAAADADADHTRDCFDCAPADPTRHPGAAESCDGLDDDCDFRV